MHMAECNDKQDKKQKNRERRVD